ncbi:TPA: 50S ribosomal protein L10 [archaeon]|nr:50S ribosomal protein L10 [Candidatus Undinarchaeales archaeon SRR5007147.bin71]
MREGDVPQQKVDLVNELVSLINENSVVALLDITNLPSKQLLQMKHALRGKAVVRMARKSSILRALEQTDGKGLVEYLKGMPAILVSSENPFMLSKILKESKATAPAKEGTTLNKDIVIPAGETSFAPGPIVGEMQTMGVKAAIEGGKVVVKEDSVLAKEGEVVDKQKADLMAKLELEPVEIGLGMLAAYENGLIFTSDVLDIDTEETLGQLAASVANAISLAYSIKYPTSDNIEMFIKEAFVQAKGLAMEAGYMCSATSEDLLKQAAGEASALESKVPEAPAEDSKEESEEKSEEASSEEEPKAEKSEETPEEEKKEEKSEAPEEKPAKKEAPAEEPAKEEAPAEEASPEESKEETPVEEKTEEEPAKEEKKEDSKEEKAIEEQSTEDLLAQNEEEIKKEKKETG